MQANRQIVESLKRDAEFPSKRLDGLVVMLEAQVISWDTDLIDLRRELHRAMRSRNRMQIIAIRQDIVRTDDILRRTKARLNQANRLLDRVIDNWMSRE